VPSVPSAEALQVQQLSEQNRALAEQVKQLQQQCSEMQQQQQRAYPGHRRLWRLRKTTHRCQTTAPSCAITVTESVIFELTALTNDMKPGIMQTSKEAIERRILPVQVDPAWWG
jgi:TolA-binding protein